MTLMTILYDINDINNDSINNTLSETFWPVRIPGIIF